MLRPRSGRNDRRYIWSASTTKDPRRVRLYRTEVHGTVVWEKLKAMREGADIATRRRWGSYQRSNSQLKERSKVERIDCMCYTVHWHRRKVASLRAKGLDVHASPERPKKIKYGE